MILVDQVVRVWSEIHLSALKSQWKYFECCNLTSFILVNFPMPQVSSLVKWGHKEHPPLWVLDQKIN